MFSRHESINDGSVAPAREGQEGRLPPKVVKIVQTSYFGMKCLFLDCFLGMGWVPPIENMDFLCPKWFRWSACATGSFNQLWMLSAPWVKLSVPISLSKVIRWKYPFIVLERLLSPKCGWQLLKLASIVRLKLGPPFSFRSAKWEQLAFCPVPPFPKGEQTKYLCIQFKIKRKKRQKCVLKFVDPN